ADVLASGRGTPTERGLILLAMLREAGFDARPAWFTPDDNPVLPRTLPAPHLLLYPAIGVRVGKEILYIDPGTTGARPPEVPARMRGGRVLVAGRHLTVPIDTGAPRGEVRISADLQVARSGQITVVADLVPTGAAEQVLRSLLSRLDAPEWPAAVTPWITPRGDLRDLVVDVKGLDGLEPFRVILRYTEPTKLQGTGTTLRGPVRDIVAPWLAETLPPGIAIEERIRVVPPEGLLALTAIRPEHGESNAILLNRSLATEGTELMLSSDWRVLGARSPGAELQKLPKDTEVLLFPADATARRAAKRLDLADNDKAVIDALLLWRLDEPEKARKVLDRLHPRKLSVIELGALIAHYASPGDRRPWQALVTLVGTDDERIAVIDDLVTTGDRRLAWQLATFMAKNSADPVARTKALVQVARFQGPEQPDGQADPEGHKAWRDPIKLLEKASSLAGDRQDLVRLELARAFLRQGTPMAAEDLLDKAMEAPTPLTKAVRAEFGAMTGVQGVDVLGLVKEAIAEAPFDPDVRESAGRALAFLGRRRQGVADILLAAELAGNDSTRWLTAARFAADFGDLRAAVFAARRASDLEPRGLVQAVQLQLLAKLARNTSALELAVRRSGGTPLYDDIPDDLDSLVTLAANQIPQDPVEAAEGKAHPWKLALLRHHVGDVESDPRLLLERAMLHYERGMTEDAAQDGSLLLDRYQSPDGARFVLGGVTARFRHADPASLVRRYTRSAEVRDALVDLELVTGGRPEP
ncbi:MAG: hypothetical protein KC656_22750, partial [Myxococcales bacterium]|nr:hypothetical protein [Myxococcales bacterium]